MILGVDLETFSAADINDGADAYASHETTGVFCAAFGFSSKRGECELIRWTPGHELPARAVRHIEAGGKVLAHNSPFEASIIRRILAPKHGWPAVKFEQWLDTLAIAAGLNLPLGLGKLAAVLKGAAPKDDEGNKLIKRLSKVKRDKATGQWIYPVPTPEEFERICLYNGRDVVSMLDCYWRLPQPTPTEREVMRVDRIINTRGMRIDCELAETMRKVAEARAEEITTQTWLFTGELFGLTSPKQLAAWLIAQGVALPTVPRKKKDGTFRQTPSVDRAAIAKMLDRPDLPPMARKVLLSRVEAGRATSLGKLKRIPRAVSKDGRLRHALRYCMAGPGRWSSEIVQVHNLARSTKLFKACADQFAIAVRGRSLQEIARVHPVLEGLSFMLRSLVVAPAGRELVGGDYSAVEARGIAWLAGQQDALDAFADPKRDIYVEDAARVGSDDRDLGKEQRLGLGYGMGAIKFYDRVVARTLQARKPIPPTWTLKRARQVQLTWRRNNPKIVKFWHDLQNAVAVVVADRSKVIPVGADGRIVVSASKACLRIMLPSGRVLHYWRPSQRDVMRKIETVDPDGNRIVTEVLMRELSFFTAGKTGMERDTTYGGKLAENVTQAVCRDLLAEALIRLEAAGFEVVLHVHDSIAAETVAMWVGGPDEKLTDFCRIMAVVPTWATGFPVAVDGYRSGHFRG